MKYSRIGLTWLCLALLYPIQIAQADSWAAAREITVRSGNRLYHARIIPGDSLGDTWGFSGAQRGEYARALLEGPGIRDRLTVTLLNPIAPVEAVLLDDGSLMTFDNWHNMGYGKVVVLYDRTGKVVWSHELEDVFSEDLLRSIPHSVSSRWWRKSPLEWALEGETSSTMIVVVTLWDGRRLKLRLSDGRLELRGPP